MVIAIVGAGGKTTVAEHIGKKLASQGRRTLFTTTTKIFRPDGETVWLGDAAGIRAESGYMVAAQGPLPGGKLKGFTARDIRTIADSGLFDVILVEADGAARKPVKAPNESEPVYPASVDLIIGVIGADCLGQPVSEEFVHRPELFRHVTGAETGEPIAACHLVSLISHPDGLFRHAPAGVPRVVFLNKYDTIDETALSQAEEIVHLSPYPMLLTGYGRGWFDEFAARYLSAPK